MINEGGPAVILISSLKTFYETSLWKISAKNQLIQINNTMWRNGILYVLVKQLQIYLLWRWKIWWSWVLFFHAVIDFLIPPPPLKSRTVSIVQRSSNYGPRRTTRLPSPHHLIYPLTPTRLLETKNGKMWRPQKAKTGPIFGWQSGSGGQKWDMWRFWKVRNGPIFGQQTGSGGQKWVHFLPPQPPEREGGGMETQQHQSTQTEILHTHPKTTTSLH